MTPAKTSDEYVLFRMKEVGPGRYELLDQELKKSYGVNSSFASFAPDILQDHPIDTKITMQWDDSQCISFVPAALRLWLKRGAPAAGVRKDEVEDYMARLEDQSRARHEENWA